MQTKTESQISADDIKAAREFLLGQRDDLGPITRPHTSSSRHPVTDVLCHKGIVRARQRTAPRV